MTEGERVADPTTAPVETASALLWAVRTDDVDRRVTARKTLARVRSRDLLAALDDDDARRAFWVNVYNAFAQMLLDRDPDRYERSRRSFFGWEAIRLAGRRLSLDDVEHGILRRSRPTVGLGYLNTPDLLVGDFERRARVDDVDPRVHFALNCGAASCPPIAAYSRDSVDDELDLATRSHLDVTVSYDVETDTATVPRVFLWYRGDFGGTSGVRRFLHDHDAVPPEARPAIEYDDYDWTRRPGAFVDSGRSIKE